MVGETAVFDAEEERKRMEDSGEIEMPSLSVIVDGDSPDGTVLPPSNVYELRARTMMTFGRNDPRVRNDIAVNSTIVSRRHGTFEYSGGKWYFQIENKPLNPTYVNEKQMGVELPRKVELSDGDAIRVDGPDLMEPDNRGVLILFSTRQTMGGWRSVNVDKPKETIIGRDPKLPIDQPLDYISKKHVLIKRDVSKTGLSSYYMSPCADGVTLNKYRDMESNNHTEPEKWWGLREKDVITIGYCHFIFTQGHIVYYHYDEDATIRQTKAIAEKMRREHPLGGPILSVNIDNVDVKVKDGKMLKRIIRGKEPDERKRLLEDVRFGILKGSCTAIVGVSGAGKSVLLDCITGERRHYEGEIKIRNGSSWEDARKVAVKYVGYVPQKNLGNSVYTVEEELAEAAKLRVHSSDAARIRDRIDRVIDVMNLGAQRKTKFSELSGGQQRRVSVARELVGDHPIVCLDEPDAGLSVIDKERFFTHVRELQNMDADNPLTVIMVIHDVDNLSMFDQIVLVEKKDKTGPGTVVNTDTPLGMLKRYNVTSFQDMMAKVNGNPKEA